MNYPLVSVIVPCRNEEKYIEKSLGSLLKNDYPKEKLEIIVVDGQSTVRTKDILRELILKNPALKLFPNPSENTPAALNIGIRAAKGDIIIRADAHSQYPKDYISKCVKHLIRTDAWCVGGPLNTAAGAESVIAKMIASVLSCSFGVGDSYFRTTAKEMYTDTVPFGAFKKDVFKRVGLYDERLIRNQDNELTSRIIKQGGKILMTPEIKCTYYARASLPELLASAYSNGTGNAFAQKLYPYTFKWRHFLPMIFFIGTICCLGVVVAGLLFKNAPIAIAGIFPIAPYFFLAILFSLRICQKNKINTLLFPLAVSVFFLYHFIYGYGILKGWLLILTGLWKEKIKQE